MAIRPRQDVIQPIRVPAVEAARRLVDLRLVLRPGRRFWAPSTLEAEHPDHAAVLPGDDQIRARPRWIRRCEVQNAGLREVHVRSGPPRRVVGSQIVQVRPIGERERPREVRRRGSLCRSGQAREPVPRTWTSITDNGEEGTIVRGQRDVMFAFERDERRLAQRRPERTQSSASAGKPLLDLDNTAHRRPWLHELCVPIVPCRRRRRPRRVGAPWGAAHR